MQSVVKCSASEPNRSWKQKPFPKSHSRTPPLFLLPLSLSRMLLFLFYSFSVFFVGVSLAVLGIALSISHICLCSEHFTVAGSSRKRPTPQIPTYERHKDQNSDKIAEREMRKTQRETDLTETKKKSGACVKGK